MRASFFLHRGGSAVPMVYNTLCAFEGCSMDWWEPLFLYRCDTDSALPNYVHQRCTRCTGVYALEGCSMDWWEQAFFSLYDTTVTQLALYRPARKWTRGSFPCITRADKGWKNSLIIVRKYKTVWVFIFIWSILYLRGTIIIRTCHQHKNPYIPLFLVAMFGPDYCVPR